VTTFLSLPFLLFSLPSLLFSPLFTSLLYLSHSFLFGHEHSKFLFSKLCGLASIPRKVRKICPLTPALFRSLSTQSNPLPSKDENRVLVGLKSFLGSIGIALLPPSSAFHAVKPTTLAHFPARTLL